LDKQDKIGGGEVAKEKIFWTLVGDRFDKQDYNQHVSEQKQTFPIFSMNW
jgi:hypothetical protein